MDMLATIKKKILKMKPELVSKYHISSIGLFSSVVRNDFTPESDIDIVVDFRAPIGIGFIYLANELESKLNRKVDLVSMGGIKPAYLKVIEPQIVYV